VLLADVLAGPQSGVASWPLVVSGPNLFFVGFSPATGEELWRSDGTAAGTALVRDVEPGAGYGSPGAMIAPICASGSVLFAGADSIHGREMWITDGTTAGTRLLFELVAGPGSGVAGTGTGWATLLGTTWVFLGTSAATGDELYRFETSASRAPCTSCPVAGCPGSNGTPALGTVGQPRLGNAAFAVRVSSARPTTLALLLLDGPGGSTALAGGCTLFTGVTPAVFAQLTDATGTALQVLPIPNDPGLLGAVLRSQWTVIDPAGAFLQTLSFSNGCYVVLGN
jgi:ELWxxDGT repeat protein